MKGICDRCGEEREIRYKTSVRWAHDNSDNHWALCTYCGHIVSAELNKFMGDDAKKRQRKRINDRECSTCNGAGWVYDSRSEAPLVSKLPRIDCSACNGEGRR